MNVFKLLSRSAKASQASPVQKLPSSGAAANPQLFGYEDIGQGNGAPNKSKKRKRGENTVDSVAIVPSEIDFFGSTPAESKKQSKEKKQEEADTLGNIASQNIVPERQPDSHTIIYDEDECKRVLRSHKLKITILEDFTSSEPAETQRTKKKSKKRKLEEREKEKEKAKKKDKRQLYPQPLTSFAELRTRYGISRRLAENIQEQGYRLPTEVQLGALPLLLGKKPETDITHSRSHSVDGVPGWGSSGDIDLLTIAPTGSGKTIAFLVPIINLFLSESQPQNVKVGPRAVIVAPTRELASQIVNEARKLAKGTNIKASLMRKGMKIVERQEGEEEAEDVEGSASEEESSADDRSTSKEPEINEVQKPRRKRETVLVKSQILVTTPLALLNALKFGDKVLPLPSVQRLILDEADVLLDPLFRDQTLSIWNACSSPRLSVGLWSATMGSNIEALALSTINDRWESLNANTSISRPPLIRLVVGLKDTAIPNISHKLTYAATEQGKLLGLRQLLSPTHVPSDASESTLRPPFLVFTQTIPRAIALHSELLYDIPSSAGGSSRIAVLHANLSSSARENIMTRFRKGEVWILITTDLLARGVDFRGLNGVVNYDVPNSAAAYVHRVGRTGRAGREGGVAVTFYTEEDIPYIKQIANVIQSSTKQRGKNGEEADVQQWLLDALPTPSKRDKQQLKKRGVEARRTARGKDEHGKGRARISTKSGYERRVENNRRGAKVGSAMREQQESRIAANVSESEFEGFE